MKNVFALIFAFSTFGLAAAQAPDCSTVSFQKFGMFPFKNGEALSSGPSSYETMASKKFLVLYAESKALFGYDIYSSMPVDTKDSPEAMTRFTYDGSGFGGFPWLYNKLLRQGMMATRIQTEDDLFASFVIHVDGDAQQCLGFGAGASLPSWVDRAQFPCLILKLDSCLQ